MEAWHPSSFGEALAATAAFGLIGIALLVVGYKAFDKLTPGLHIEKELSEKNNVAVAIVIAAVIIGVSIIVARTVG